MDQTGLGGRYPDPPSGSSTRASSATGCRSRGWSGSRRGAGGARGRCGSATGGTCCGATSPTSASCAGTRRPGAVGVFRRPSNYANGNTRDRQGRLVTCEHGTRRVTRTEYDGAITVLADRFDGQAAQFAQRRGGEVRRVDLVHRSALRHPRRLRGQARRRRTAENVYRVEADRRGDAWSRTRRAERALLLARRDDALHRRVRAAPNRLIRGLRRSRRRAAAREQARLRSTAGRARRMGCAATWTAICGAAGAWGARSSTA